jgi:hypothetical protein
MAIRKVRSGKSELGMNVNTPIFLKEISRSLIYLLFATLFTENFYGKLKTGGG